MEMSFEKVTVRGRGKAHYALRTVTPQGIKTFHIACGCPGSQTGRLRNKCRIVAEGWAAANCGNYPKTAERNAQ